MAAFGPEIPEHRGESEKQEKGRCKCRGERSNHIGKIQHPQIRGIESEDGRAREKEGMQRKGADAPNGGRSLPGRNVAVGEIRLVADCARFHYRSTAGRSVR